MEEDSYIVSNFHSICRLCLCKTGLMSPLFEHFIEGEDDIPLFSKIAEIGDIQIFPNDGLPTRICHRCLYKTEKCLKFRSQCATSDAKLRRLTRKLPSRQSDADLQPMEGYVRHNGEGDYKDPHYLLEDSVVMVVDPNLEYDSSDQSENESPPVEPIEEDVEAVEETFKDKVFMCQYCDRAFTDTERWKQHEQKDHDPRAPWGCEGCGLVFADRAGQAAHLRSVHNCMRPYNCSQCDKAFGRRSDLRKHSVVHTGVRPYRCHFCMKSFSRNTNLSKHLRIHSGQKPHVCPQCPRSFISKGDLSRHALVHSGAKPFACSMCPLTFGRRDKLVKHEARHNRINENDSFKAEPETTDEVVTLDTFKNLQGHLVGESQSPEEYADYPRVPDHIIGESSFNYSRQTTLKQEVDSADSALSDEDLPNGTTETAKNKLKITGKLFKCQDCPKKFTSLSLCQHHVALHHSSKLFRCKLCSKSFARKRELDRHAIVHTGFKPYECSKCDKKFGRKDKLVRHERIHDEKKEYYCFECPSSFTRKDSLMSHIKTHFPDFLTAPIDPNINSDDLNEQDEEEDMIDSIMG